MVERYISTQNFAQHDCRTMISGYFNQENYRYNTPLPGFLGKQKIFLFVYYKLRGIIAPELLLPAEKWNQMDIYSIKKAPAKGA